LKLAIAIGVAVVLIVVGVILAVYFTGGFDKKSEAAIGVSYGGEQITTATADDYIILPETADFEVADLAADDYTVTGVAMKDGTNFSFTIDHTPYSWSDFNGRDFTKGFEITKTEKGFTIKHGTFEDVISKIAGATSDQVLVEDSIGGWLFDLVIASGDNSTTIHFGFEMTLALNPSVVVF
jgi:hypothetical protein